MDYEALKDQWSEVEDRDGVRLSWNTFPSSRMVQFIALLMEFIAYLSTGSLATRGSYRRPLHSLEREARYPHAPV